MNFTFLTIIFSLVSSCSISKKETDCSVYKTGNFKFIPRDGHGDFVFQISRTNSLQIETDPKSGKYSKLSIRWTDSCIYEVLVLQSTFRYSDTIEKIRRTIPMKTEILSGTKEYYVFKSTREKSNVVLTDTMWVIR